MNIAKSFTISENPGVNMQPQIHVPQNDFSTNDVSIAFASVTSASHVAVLV